MHAKNPYLFAVTKTPASTYPGTEVIRLYTQGCGAKNLQNLTSTKLRKKFAALTRVKNLS